MAGIKEQAQERKAGYLRTYSPEYLPEKLNLMLKLLSRMPLPGFLKQRKLQK